MGERTQRVRPKRARCSVCGFSQRLRTDGMVGRHPVYVGSEPHLCEGSGREPRGGSDG